MRILSTGIDIVEVARIKDIYDKYDYKFLSKVLTQEEIELLKEKGKGFYESLAARVAAKESVYKALNSYSSSSKPRWKEIKIYNEESGSPSVLLDKKLNSGVTVVLSLSHTDKYAVANALVVRE